MYKYKLEYKSVLGRWVLLAIYKNIDDLNSHMEDLLTMRYMVKVTPIPINEA